MPSDANGGAEPPRRAFPRGAFFVAILGWLIVAGAIIAFAFMVLAIGAAEASLSQKVGGITAMAGIALGIAGIGLLLVITGRSRLEHEPSGALKLWAKNAIVIGTTLGLGLPLFVGGGVMINLHVVLDPINGQEEPLALRSVSGFLMFATVGSLIGLVTIAPAIIWGRRTNSEPDRGVRSTLPMVAVILGWMIVALAIIAFIGVVIGVTLDPSVPKVGVLIFWAGVALSIADIGLLLVIAGRSRRLNAEYGSLKLWAKLTIALGTILGVGVPMMICGPGLIAQSVTHGSAQGHFDPVPPVIKALIFSAAPFLIGFAAIASAFIWGRRTPLPSIPDVFS